MRRERGAPTRRPADNLDLTDEIANILAAAPLDSRVLAEARRIEEAIRRRESWWRALGLQVPDRAAERAAAAAIAGVDLMLGRLEDFDEEGFRDLIDRWRRRGRVAA